MKTLHYKNLKVLIYLIILNTIHNDASVTNYQDI